MDEPQTDLRVELCGRLADPFGPLAPLRLPAGGCAAGQLIALVAEQHPGLAPLLAAVRVRVCVNEEIVGADAPVRKGDLVALFPPVSGG